MILHLVGIDLNIKNKILNNQLDNIDEYFSFSSVGKALPTFKYVYPENEYTSDNYVKTNFSNGCVNAIKLSHDLLNEKYNYLSLQSEYTKFLGKLLFESNEWENIKQKFSSNLSNEFYLLNSQYDVTITFWTKFTNASDIDKMSILSFLTGVDVNSKFSINPVSYSSVNYSNNSDNETADSFGNYESKLVSGLFANDFKDRNSWVMWSVKIDNTSRYRKRAKKENQFEDFKNYIGLNVTTYIYETVNNNELKVKRTNSNFYAISENEKYTLNDFDLKKYDYVWEPFKTNPFIDDLSEMTQQDYDSQFNDFKINIGYSQESAGLSINRYYYNGYLRNLTFFKGHLTAAEEEGLFKLGILNDYDWPSEYDRAELSKLINSGRFFLGLISVYNSNNINILNCDLKYNGNTYKINKEEQ